ncbi:N-acetylmuramoyl-L-alanine amidase [Streptomyces sp. NPDC021224]|uniref:N-acetylmuramoyl-L-alanine amidase n=1 Tax=unclassified Streptomyces TaxID=2593676 RepID=UPI003790F4E9
MHRPNPGEPSRRSLLRGGLGLGAAATAGLAADLWPAASAPAATPAANRAARAAAAAVDYPSATWAPASTANYTASNRPTSYPIQMVVIHVTQETFADTITLFQDPAHAATAHYVVRSADGAIDQCVREHDIAWHAGNWDYNTRSIGIEHEGWVDQPSYFTTAMYHSSAALTAAICDKYGIPKDRDHIIGHVQVPGTDHTDPGPNWDWVRYIRLVNGV